MWSLGASKHRFGDLTIHHTIPTLKSLSGRGLQPEIVWRQCVMRNRTALDFKRERFPRSGDLIQSIGAMNHEASVDSQVGQRLGHQFSGAKRMGTHKLHRCSSGIGQRTQDVEHRPHLQLGPGRLRVLHRRMNRGRKQKRNPHFPERLTHLRGIEVNVYTESLQNVGAPALARNRTVPVFGHPYAGSGHHERRNGGDVKRSHPVPAGAACVEQYAAVAGARVYSRSFGSHRPCKPQHFPGGLAFHPQSYQKGRNLRRADFPAQDQRHRLLSVLGRQILTGTNPVQIGQQRHVMIELSAF